MTRSLAIKTSELVGESVRLQGWVDTKRDHGKVTFVDLRDRSGVVQIVGGTELKKLSVEDVIEIQGEVVARDAAQVNEGLETGTVEVRVNTLTILNEAKPLPFPIDTDGYDIDEVVRLKHRYIDLKRARLQKNIRRRSEFVQRVREFLFEHDFAEIETPMLTQSTQEGSRDFVVPSRLQPGKFFALPQSPQQYKQLLMAGGFERYFQIARCVRDEDLRADRGFEHTQIDIELSFVEQKDVMALDEAMITSVMEAMGATITEKPFPVITYKEAMDRYGEDKFDMRTEEQKANGELAFAWVVDFPFFKQVDKDDAAEVADGKSGWTFTHNPFSMPKPEYLEQHLAGERVGEILTTQYDLVCNGYEVGGGSIRAHRPDILKATYEIMGYSPDEIADRVGHMLDAFSYGCPPHGGLAHGIERLIMILEHEEYLREVQAFPQTGRGSTSVMHAPGAISDQQLADLGLKLIGAEGGSVYERLIAMLSDSGVDYEHLSHEPVRTSEEAARVRPGITLEQGAKAMVLEIGTKHVLYVLPADMKADLKALRKHFGTSKVNLAKFDDIETITGVAPGAVPPFGSLMGMPTLVHESLLTHEVIAFNAGRHDRSVVMKSKDFMNVEQAELWSAA